MNEGIDHESKALQNRQNSALNVQGGGAPLFTVDALPRRAKAIPVLISDLHTIRDFSANANLSDKIGMTLISGAGALFLDNATEASVDSSRLWVFVFAFFAGAAFVWNGRSLTKRNKEIIDRILSEVEEQS